ARAVFLRIGLTQRLQVVVNLFVVDPANPGPTRMHGLPKPKYLQELEIPIIWRAQATDDLRLRCCGMTKDQLEGFEANRLIRREKRLFEFHKIRCHRAPARAS